MGITEPKTKRGFRVSGWRPSAEMECGEGPGSIPEALCLRCSWCLTQWRLDVSFHAVGGVRGGGESASRRGQSETQ